MMVKVLKMNMHFEHYILLDSLCIWYVLIIFWNVCPIRTCRIRLQLEQLGLMLEIHGKIKYSN